MKEIPQNKNFAKNLDKYSCLYDEQPCCVCAKPIKKDNQKYCFHSWEGAYIVDTDELYSHSEDEQSCSYSGLIYIGSDCLKKHPELKKYLTHD